MHKRNDVIPTHILNETEINATPALIHAVNEVGIDAVHILVLTQKLGMAAVRKTPTCLPLCSLGSAENCDCLQSSSFTRNIITVVTRVKSKALYSEQEF